MNALVRPLTWILGIALTIVGIIGFINDPVLGLFEVNAAHNIVHLASGLIALFSASRGFQYSRMYLILFGLIYAVVTVAGFMGLEPVVSMLDINDMDNYLHLVIAAVTLLVGFGSRKA